MRRSISFNSAYVKDQQVPSPDKKKGLKQSNYEGPHNIEQSK